MPEAPPHAALKNPARAWFESLRDRICAEFEAIEAEAAGAAPSARFERTAWQRAAEAVKPANSRTAPPRRVEGAGINGWKQALNSLESFFPGRIPVDAR